MNVFCIQPEAVYPLPASFVRKRTKKEHTKSEDDDDDDAAAPEQVKKEEQGESDDDEDVFGKEDESDVRDMKYKLENLCLHSGNVKFSSCAICKTRFFSFHIEIYVF